MSMSQYFLLHICYTWLVAINPSKVGRCIGNRKWACGWHPKIIGARGKWFFCYSKRLICLVYFQLRFAYLKGRRVVCCMYDNKRKSKLPGKGTLFLIHFLKLLLLVSPS